MSKLNKEDKNFMSFLLRNWATLYTRGTDAERAMEPAVAALGGVYRYQHPFFDLGYIVDFALMDRKTVVEVDGKSHLEHKAKIKDLTRTLALMKKGWRVVRVLNEDALRDPAGSLQRALSDHEDTRAALEDRLRRLEADVGLKPQRQGIPFQEQRRHSHQERDRVRGKLQDE